MSPRTNEKAVNLSIARHLRELLDTENRNPSWVCEAERHGVLQGSAGKAPDIVIIPSGWSPVIIETEYAPASTVEADAISRLGEVLRSSPTSGPIENVVAVRMPAELQTSDQAVLENKIATSEEFEWRLISTPPPREGELDLKPLFFPATGWITGSFKELADFVELSIISEKKLQATLDSFTAIIEEASNYLFRELESGNVDLTIVAKELYQEPDLQTWKMACLIIGNSLAFQSILATKYTHISSSTTLERNSNNFWFDTLDEWDKILEINYFTIFEIAKKVVQALDSTIGSKLLKILNGLCNKLTEVDPTTTGDIAGQMFGRLIADRKLVGSYYTLPSSAHLLAELAVSRLDNNMSQNELTSLQVADFACGTGTLLTASYHRIASRARGAGLKLTDIHPEMLENVMIGCDIIPPAVHLTSTMLASLQPSQKFENTRIHLVPFGRGLLDDIRTGSLELLDPTYSVQDAFWSDGTRTVGGRGEEFRKEYPEDEKCDLVLMNPPFIGFTPTSSKSGEQSVSLPALSAFGASPEQKTDLNTRLDELKTIARKRRVAYSPNTSENKKVLAGNKSAGLSTFFLDLAHNKIKPGGTIAFIVPTTFMAGGGYKKSRELLAENYKDIYFISIAATTTYGRSFSSDTGQAETMFVATKRENIDDSELKVFYITLFQRPATIIEAIEIAKECNRLWNNNSKSNSGIFRIGKEKYGSWFQSNTISGGYAATVSGELVSYAEQISYGELLLPIIGKQSQISLCQLDELGNHGLNHAQIGLPPDSSRSKKLQSPLVFEKTDNWHASSYPALWNQIQDNELTLYVAPDVEGEFAPGREAEKIDNILQTRSRFHVPLQFGLTSSRLAACLTMKPSLGGRSWPTFKFADSRWDYLAVLWANSTPGLVNYWWISTKNQKGRANLSTTKRISNLITIDPRKIGNDLHTKAEEIVNYFADKQFLLAYQAYMDDVRQELDQKLFSELLGIDWNEIEEPLAILRNQWCSEPTVNGGKTPNFG